MLTLVVGGIVLVGVAAIVLSDSDYVRLIKETILRLVMVGYEEAKILKIMQIYLYW